eukprot:TRINITY_DN95078_c0_g1_i1.p1 TRINITY_DN95078_c0_g1~~TRINITY_DN95078_c0_g1_i1.p1  ORF type:complete len:152 (-),score=44.57 TRINITY_DN95078_c0_g1_i1:30-485(-)
MAGLKNVLLLALTFVGCFNGPEAKGNATDDAGNLRGSAKRDEIVNEDDMMVHAGLLFQHMDKDVDGIASFEELTAFLREEDDKNPEADAKAALAEFDHDKDGYLNEDEFGASIKKSLASGKIHLKDDMEESEVPKESEEPEEPQEPEDVEG